MPTRIFAVDDSPTMRRILAISFERQAEFELQVADHAKGLLGLLRLQTPDLLLLDARLPDMDALTFLREIREGLGLPTLPVLFLVGQKHDPASLPKDPFAFELQKPFQTHEILAKVAELLKLNLPSSLSYADLEKADNENPLLPELAKEPKDGKEPKESKPAKSSKETKESKPATPPLATPPLISSGPQPVPPQRKGPPFAPKPMPPQQKSSGPRKASADPFVPFLAPSPHALSPSWLTNAASLSQTLALPIIHPSQFFFSWPEGTPENTDTSNEKESSPSLEEPFLRPASQDKEGLVAPYNVCFLVPSPPSDTQTNPLLDAVEPVLASALAPAKDAPSTAEPASVSSAKAPVPPPLPTSQGKSPLVPPPLPPPQGKSPLVPPPLPTAQDKPLGNAPPPPPPAPRPSAFFGSSAPDRTPIEINDLESLERSPTLDQLDTIRTPPPLAAHDPALRANLIEPKTAKKEDKLPVLVGAPVEVAPSSRSNVVVGKPLMEGRSPHGSRDLSLEDVVVVGMPLDDDQSLPSSVVLGEVIEEEEIILSPPPPRPRDVIVGTALTDTAPSRYPSNPNLSTSPGFSPHSAASSPRPPGSPPAASSSSKDSPLAARELFGDLEEIHLASQASQVPLDRRAFEKEPRRPSSLASLEADDLAADLPVWSGTSTQPTHASRPPARIGDGPISRPVADPSVAAKFQSFEEEFAEPVEERPRPKRARQIERIFDRSPSASPQSSPSSSAAAQTSSRTATMQEPRRSSSQGSSLVCQEGELHLLLSERLDHGILATLYLFVEQCQKMVQKKISRTPPLQSSLGVLPTGSQTRLLWSGDALLLQNVMPSFLECFGGIPTSHRNHIEKELQESLPASQQSQVSKTSSQIEKITRPFSHALRDHSPTLAAAFLEQLQSGLQLPVSTINFTPAPLEEKELRAREQRRQIALALQAKFPLQNLGDLLEASFDTSLQKIVPRTLPPEIIYLAVFHNFLAKNKLRDLAQAIQRAEPSFSPEEILAYLKAYPSK